MNMIKHEEIKPNRIFMDRLIKFDNTIKDLMKKRVSNKIILLFLYYNIICLSYTYINIYIFEQNIIQTYILL